jgi:hypothetical protein
MQSSKQNVTPTPLMSKPVAVVGVRTTIERFFTLGTQPIDPASSQKRESLHMNTA